MGKHRKGLRMKPAAAVALSEQQTFQRLAAKNGLSLSISRPRRGRTVTFHWMYDDMETGERLMNYWPATGTWMAGKEKGCEPNLMMAFNLAVRFLRERQGTDIDRMDMHLDAIARM